HPGLPSFPTRRSSDLRAASLCSHGRKTTTAPASATTTPVTIRRGGHWRAWAAESSKTTSGVSAYRSAAWLGAVDFKPRRKRYWRSEEHTSELQSLTNL